MTTLRFQHPKYRDGAETQTRAVRPSELREGMVVLSWSHREPVLREFIATRDCDSSGPYTVTTFIQNSGGRMVRATQADGQTINLVSCSDGLVWMLVVDRADIAEFPHRCPACGMAAYVGAVTRVSHATQAACPDR